MVPIKNKNTSFWGKNYRTLLRQLKLKSEKTQGREVLAL